MTNRSTSEKTKRIALVVFGVIFAGVLVYQIFLSGPAKKPKLNSQAGNTRATPSSKPAPVAPQPRLAGASAQQDALIQQMLSDLTPLNLSLLTAGADRSDKPGARGNIFAYYVPPPPPPPTPPPPPPIQLISLQPQTAVASTPRTFTLVVTGNQFPADAQILFDGTPRVTKRVGDNQLSTEVIPNDYPFARNINIDVKSQSEPGRLYSNTIQFIVQPSPEPQFVYKGRLGALNQPEYNYAVFELSGGAKEIKRGKAGDTIMGVWRIDVVASDYVDITHTQYDIKRRVPLQDKAR